MTGRHYLVPWGLRHVLRWVLTALAWLASRGKPPPFVRGIEATTPGPFTLWYYPDPAEDVIAHEEAHQEQCRRMGWPRYVWMWCKQVAGHGYAAAELEREAREKAGQS